MIVVFIYMFNMEKNNNKGLNGKFTTRSASSINRLLISF